MLVDIVRRKEISEKHKIASNEVMIIPKDVFLEEYDVNKEDLIHLFYTAINYIFGYCFKDGKDQFLNLDKNIIEVIQKKISDNDEALAVVLYGAIFVDDKSEKHFMVNYMIASKEDFNDSYALIGE